MTNILNKLAIAFVIAGVSVVGTFVPANASTSQEVCEQQDAAYSFCAGKKVDKKYAKAGETLTYTLIFTNTGTERLHNVMISDEIMTEKVKYVAGSSYIKKGALDTVQMRDSWFDNSNPFNAGTLLPGSTITVTFKAIVQEGVKDGELLRNIGKFNTSYGVESIKGYKEEHGKSYDWGEWKKCMAVTTAKVAKPTSTPTPTPTPEQTPTPTPTPSPTGEVKSATPTPAPVTELPSTGPGAAVVASIGGIVSALMGRKYFISR